MASQEEKSQIVKIDGISYHALLAGDPQSQPLIILIHALMSSLEMWDPTIPILQKAGYATLRFNHIGHSSTPAPSSPSSSFSMDDITHHIHHLISKTTGQRKVFAIMGCSISGVLALRYAMLYPNSVQKSISIAAPGIKTPEKAKALWAERIRKFEQGQGEELCQQTVQRWFPGSLPRDLAAREVSLGHVRQCSMEGYKVLAEAISNYDFEEGVQGISGTECLILAGTEDGAIDVEGLRELSGRIEGAEFVRLEGAGHLPPLHMAGEFEGVLMGFL